MRLRRYSCRVVRDLLPLHVGGDLEPEKAEPVDEHLHACLTCFREYRELLAVRGHLGVLADQPLPTGILDGFADEVMARIALGEEGPAAELPAAPPRLRQFTRYAAAAALLLALSLGLRSLGGPGSGQPAPLAPTITLAPPADVRPAAPAPVAQGSRLEPAGNGGAGLRGVEAPYTGRMATTVGVTADGPIVLPYRDGHADASSASLAPFHQGLVPEGGRKLRLRDH